VRVEPAGFAVGTMSGDDVTDGLCSSEGRVQVGEGLRVGGVLFGDAGSRSAQFAGCVFGLADVMFVHERGPDYRLARAQSPCRSPGVSSLPLQPDNRVGNGSLCMRVCRNCQAALVHAARKSG